MSNTQAQQATMQSFFNCYLKETGNYEQLDRDQMEAGNPYLPILSASPIGKAVRVPLRRHGMEIIAPLRYWSMTERHLFSFPFHYATPGCGHLLPLDYVTLTTLLTKELALERDLVDFPDDLIERVIQSCQHIASYLSARKKDEKQLYHVPFHFIDAEQSLLLGHLMHPTPKSRQGLSDIEQSRYSPELKGAFPLHLFRAHRSIVREDSTRPFSATESIKREMLSDPELSQAFKSAYCQPDDYSLLPVHPQQAAHLLEQPQTQQWIEDGLLIDLGPQGRPYYATSSLRSLYHPDANFMLKGSVNIKVTNSLRVNKQKELERGVEVSRLLQTEIGDRLRASFPSFSIIEDPAYLTLANPEQEESGFELALRDNPFKGEEGRNVTLVAGLCQDHPAGEKSRLARIILSLTAKEGRSAKEVSLDWFRRYLDLSLQPLMWLYFEYGIALEAHQQNSLVKLDNGYPCRFYYRDNQGYYYCESMLDKLQLLLPDIDKKSQTMCKDAVADERLRYYFFLNHLMGLINGFGTAGLIDERALLSELRETLKELLPRNREPSMLLKSLLDDERLPCKANLLTRLHDMDELTGPMESQSVYVPIHNPLMKGVLTGHEIRNP
ncbi:IucA/IucC family protein [Desmospora profundinema]|uniref:Siderophore synthetase component n=1 Tax=Desmospora profundinema TaxID=1571184 RepID=A0ABU1INQ0_9BACL|nr:IucA/IucC family protein [Desmospora profundinema]MDR6226415.1 siderophore synthetase component [Desmospora profundinema]